jgi:hypothetical protein
MYVGNLLVDMSSDIAGSKGLPMYQDSVFFSSPTALSPMKDMNAISSRKLISF